MRTYRLEQFGGLEGLVLKEEPAPTPGAREVLVKVRATSINFRDLAILNGWYPFPVPLGRTPLSDAAGDVVAVGAQDSIRLSAKADNKHFRT
jgi:NADPH:quinone reductase-like Zn-dependent oxidoreductase